MAHRSIAMFVLTALICLTGHPAMGAAATGPAPDRRAFTLDDLYRLRGVSDPRIAPDGQSVLITVTTPDLHRGRNASDLYRVPVGPGEPLRLTWHEAADHSPRWSPDGRSILFVSTRQDGAQLWLMPVDGGEARRLTRFPGGVADPHWLPNGRQILFTAHVFPECGADADCNERLARGLAEGPLRAHLADDLMFRHWDSWADGRVRHTFRLDLDNGTVTDLTPGPHDAPGHGPYDPALAISPDGAELCLTIKRDPDPARSTNVDLWTLCLADGQQRNLTLANPAWDGTPAYSPDGRWIAYLRHDTPRYESDCARLAVYDRQADRHTILTAGFDHPVERFIWTPDSRALLFTAQVRGRVPLYRVDLPTSGEGAPAPIHLLTSGTIRDLDLSPDGRWLALTRSTVGEPIELFRADLAGGIQTPLTGFNRAAVADVDIRPAEELWLPGDDGHPIHVFLVKPHDFRPDRRYPLILNIHGGPQFQWSDSFRGDWQVYPGAGYLVAFANPTGSTGYGQAFTAAISGDWGGRVMRDLSRVTDGLAELPFVDPDRLGAMGWSWGGYAVMRLAGEPHRFQALAAMMGIYDLPAFADATEELWFPDWDMAGPPGATDRHTRDNPADPARIARFTTPCLILTGQRDYRVPYIQSLQFFTALRRRDVPARLIVFPDDGHWPDPVRSMPFYYNAHLDWFHRWLGGAPAPYDMEAMRRNLVWRESPPADSPHRP